MDLPEPHASGLIRAQKILKGIQGLEFVYLTEKDVIRHQLVQAVIKAYERYEGGKRRE